jgi:hypothetical protein
MERNPMDEKEIQCLSGIQARRWFLFRACLFFVGFGSLVVLTGEEGAKEGLYPA